ncbi:MAG: HEAT repeat domain-containing protein [Acidobacteriota bacterium]
MRNRGGSSGPVLGLVGVALFALGCQPPPDNGPLHERLAELEERVRVLEARLVEMPVDDLQDLGTTELVDRVAAGDLLASRELGREISARGMEARQTLLRLLDEPDARARRSAALALFDLEHPEDHVAALTAAHGRETDGKTRALLLLVLARTHDEQVVSTLVGDLEHESRTVRAAAIEALSRMRPAETAVPLLRIAIRRGSGDAGFAATAFRRLGDRALPFVRDAWETLDPRERVDVLRLLSTWEGEAVDGFLRLNLKDPAPLVALEAARSLARHGDISGRDVARRRLGSDDPVVARAAREVLDLIENGP